MVARFEQHRQVTVEEYFRLEEASEERHEFRDGFMVPLGGELVGPDRHYEHSLITTNVVRLVGNRIADGPCRVLGSNLRVRLGRSILYSYPDALVICGPPQFDPADTGRRTVNNPRVIVEVLSSTTEAYDRGEKFNRYRQIDSLEEYVLVAQDRPEVETFFRQSDGTWLFAPYTGLDAIARIRCIGINLPLPEVYAGVEFAATGSEPSAPLAI